VLLGHHVTPRRKILGTPTLKESTPRTTSRSPFLLRRVWGGICLVTFGGGTTPFLGIWMEMRAVSSGVFLFDPLEEGSSTTSCESGSVTVVA
ncbi:hypothetical protein A2U01_0055220, partial [Trifolium medium]|nr:hypothetical protein [Trifolium medium]